MKQNSNFWPLSDEEAIVVLANRNGAECARQVVTTWRAIAFLFQYVGPVAWRVYPGFSLVNDAALMHREDSSRIPQCWDSFRWMREATNFPNKPEDVVTKDSLVFWIPRVAVYGGGLKAEHARKKLLMMSDMHKLPSHHLSSFGDAVTLVGLVLRYSGLTGERVPPAQCTVYTDTERGGGPLGLVTTSEGTIFCNNVSAYCPSWLVYGSFPIAVEVLS